MRQNENQAEEYINQLHLQAHPEGGYFREIYRSPQEILFPGFEGNRNLSTSIYFLLKAGQRSALHRIKSDEIWYFHDGGPLDIIEIDENGKEITTRLGKNINDGEVLQHVVKANRWFGATLPEGSDFCLVGCQVSPGFDFKDFELMP
jgi:predicted cupin superfamily sugar epimerase